MQSLLFRIEIEEDADADYIHSVLATVLGGMYYAKGVIRNVPPGDEMRFPVTNPVLLDRLQRACVYAKEIERREND